MILDVHESTSPSTEKLPAQAWIESITRKNVDDLGEGLCDLINTLSPGSVKKIHRNASGYFQRENVSFFLDACRRRGISDLFETRDVERGYDSRALAMTLARLSQHFQTDPPFVVEEETCSKKLAGFEALEMSQAMPEKTRRRRRIEREQKDPGPPAPAPAPPTTKVVYSKDRIVVHWPWQRQGDERFEGLVEAFEDRELSEQVAELKRAPGAKIKIIQHGTKTVLTSEDEEGNCCELEISI